MQPKNNTSAIERVDALIAHIGISQAAFARRCGVEPSNLNKRLSGEVKFTDNYFAKIAHAFNVNFEWLRNGIGEMFTEEKTIGKAQFAAFSQVLDANTSPVSQNIISGDKLSRHADDKRHRRQNNGIRAKDRCIDATACGKRQAGCRAE